ncbi:M50 family metallopeptidase [Ezakiella coagulans]|uniref:M50 family metallopeptidase n=1 Tax=Ezakiella coagulans TaxID=46507 RepID=UPI002014C2B5|nr:M50 family metallopeptidase [Ezakiella coagulans]UQK60754.1 site-2 protease family protein [Ezakiella coagulans]
MKIVLSLFILLFIVTVHEWGHFIAGRISGVRVYEFAIGFGPKLFSWFKNGTKFTIRLLPLGGFCSFDKDETKNSDKEKQLFEEFDDSKYTALPDASFGKKMFIILNGIIMNFVLAYVLFFFIFTFIGTQSMTVDQIMPNSVAEKVQMMPGDEILKVNDRDVKNINEFTKDKDFLSEDGFKMTIKRNGEIETIDVPSLKEDGSFGVSFKLIKSPTKAFKEAATTIGDMLGQIFGILKKIFVKVDDQMMGIVGFAGFMTKQENINLLMILLLIAGISVSVGAFNLLPIIPLDGGQAVIYIIEKIIGKPISEKARTAISYVGMAFMLYLFVRVTYNDILRLR